MAKKAKIPKSFNNVPCILIGTGSVDYTHGCHWSSAGINNTGEVTYWFGQYCPVTDKAFRPTANIKYNVVGSEVIFTITIRGSVPLFRWLKSLTNQHFTINSYQFAIECALPGLIGLVSFVNEAGIVKVHLNTKHITREIIRFTGVALPAPVSNALVASDPTDWCPRDTEEGLNPSMEYGTPPAVGVPWGGM